MDLREMNIDRDANINIDWMRMGIENELEVTITLAYSKVFLC